MTGSSPIRIEQIRATQLEFVQLIDQAERIRVPDVDDEETRVDDLVMTVAKSVDATVASIDKLFRTYENVPAPKNFDGPLVSDVAYFALVTLGEIRTDLAACVGADNPTSLSESYEQCARACRSIRKSVIAVEAAMCSHAGVKRRLTESAAVRASLKVRDAYTKLRRVILRSRPGSGAEVVEYVHFFRSVGTQVAILVGSETFRKLRLYDRFQIKVVQGRLIEWLRSDRAVKSGEHIVQDMLGFSTMLQQVSLRAELRQHDEALIVKLRAEMEADRGSATISEALLVRAAPLEGLDDELTQMMDDGERDAKRWQRCLDALLVSRFNGGVSW